MMLQPVVEIPPPLPADSETVSTALETAALFRARGDAREAMRWLRRAAESAGDAGDDVRALALSRTAADLNELLSIRRDTEPSPAPQTASPPPLPSARASAPPSSPRASAPPASAAPPPLPSPSERAAQPSPSVPSPSYPPPPSSRPRFSASYAKASAAPATGERRAKHVAITPSPSKPGVLEVQLLSDGEAPPPGSSEGFLVMMDPSAALSRH